MDYTTTTMPASDSAAASFPFCEGWTGSILYSNKPDRTGHVKTAWRRITVDLVTPDRLFARDLELPEGANKRQFLLASISEAVCLSRPRGPADIAKALIHDWAEELSDPSIRMAVVKLLVADL